MHEMAWCEGLLQALEEQAKIQHFARVHAVWLEIGALALDHGVILCTYGMETAFGGRRMVDWLSGEQLPRIC
jgi:Zn finger protein HypA/HybF involved in hydrogenase expression